MYEDKVKDVVSFMRQTENWKIVFCTRSEEKRDSCPHYESLTGECEAEGECVYARQRRMYDSSIR